MPIAAKQGRRDKVLKHLGSAHTDCELVALLETARTKVLANKSSTAIWAPPPAQHR